MVLVVLILVFTSINSLETWDFLENDHFDLTDTWGIARVKRQLDKVREKFPEQPDLVCDLLYKTSEVPFTAIVLYKTSGRLLCMGSIVDTQHILTAKKCYEKSDVDELLVLVGYYKAYWGRNSQVLPVKKVVRHDYAIALLRLDRPISYTPYIQPTKLPTTFTKTETDFTKAWPGPYKVVGFFVDRFVTPGDYIDKDKIYHVKEDHFVDYDTCTKNFSKLELEATKLFCTIGNATYCWGSWGAPVLKWMANSYFVQVGVVIADNCTAGTTGPLLAARTDVFGDWIRGNSFQGHKPM